MTTTSVASGVISSGVTLNDGDELDVLYGGYAASTVVNFEGVDVIYAGGIASGTTINFVGTEVVSSGGLADDSIVTFAGAQVISSGGLAQGALVNSGGDVYVEPGGTAAYTITNAGGQQIVSSGGLAFSDLVGGTEIIAAGGVAQVATIIGGVEIVRGGSAGNEIIGAGGSEVVSSGGVSTSDIVEGGGTLTISANAQAAGATLEDGGQLVVLEFGNASSAVISAAGSETVSSGGLDDSAMVLNGGYQEIASGGLASNADIQVGGHVMIDSGGFAAADAVSGGTLTVQAGGNVLSATIHKGGLLLVEGVSSRTTIESGGTEEIDVGGEADGTTLGTSSAEQLVAGGTASGTSATLGLIEVQAGSVVDAVLGVGARLVVDAGGTATGTVLSGLLFSATVIVLAGGTSLDTNNVGGEEKIYGTASNGSLTGVGFIPTIPGYQEIFGGGLAVAETVGDAGEQRVDADGIASATTLYDTDGGSAAQTVSAGGFALATIVSSGGVQTVAGNASGSVVNGGEIDVTAGGQTFAAEIGLSGTQVVSAGGSASGATVTAGGTLSVYGTTTGTTVSSGGKETVLSGGVASGSVVGWQQLVSSGGLASGAVVGSGGVQTVDGGSATATEIDAGGLQLVVGGVSSDAAVATGGVALVLSGGIQTSASIAAGGAETVFAGGGADGGTVARGAALTVSSGGAAGFIEVAAGGSATIGPGGVAAFDQVDAGGVETVFGRTIGESVGGTLTVSGVGATTTGTTVDGGDEAVQAGGMASGTMVGGLGGAIDELAGGAASGSVISAGGNDVVHAGGSASGSTLAGGRQAVLAGGLATGTFVASGGHQFVEDGGTAAGTQVQSGGFEVVSSGGIANGTSIAGGGTEIVSSGGVLVGSTDVAAGGTLTVAKGAVFDGANATVTLDRGAQLLVSAGSVLDLANIPLSNQGQIVLAGNTYGDGVATLRISGNVSLSGGGTVSLADLGGYTTAGIIVGADAAAVLDNVDNTISGWGLLGDGLLALTNEAGGTVTAASQILYLHTGRTVINKGVLDATTGTLLIEDGVDNAGVIAAAGGLVRLGDASAAVVVRGGSLQSTGDGSLEVTDAAALDGSSNPVSVSARVLVDSGATLTIAGTINNAGAVQLAGNTYGIGVATLRIQGAVALSGAGTISLADLGGYTTAGVIAGSSAADALDNAGNTISGWGRLGAGALSFTNEAGSVVDADTAGQTLFIDTGAGALVNRGLLEAAGGTLDIAGAASNSGAMRVGAGGTVTLHGAVANRGTVLAQSGGTLALDGGGLAGTGSVTVATGGTLDVVTTGSLDGTSQTVSLSGVAAVASGATLSLSGTINNAGAVQLAGNTYGIGVATLRIAGAVRLSGGGTISLADLGGYTTAGVIAGSSAADALDNAGNTISGWGRLGAGALSFTNEAGSVVDADTAGQTLFIDTGAGALVNRGLLEAVGGTLDVAGAASNSGAMRVGAGGTVTLHGTVANRGTVVAQSGGTLALDGGGLAGTGSVAVATGGTLDVVTTGSLDGTSQTVSLSGVAAVASGATLSLSGTIYNAGAVQLAGNTYGIGVATLRIAGAVRLSGGGTISLADLGGYTTAGVIAGSSAADALDNAGNTISGWGRLGAGALSFTNEAGSVVDADTAGQTLFIDTGAGALVNHGLLEAVGGTLDVAGGLLNDGAVEVGASGLLTLDGAVDGIGTIALDGPSLTLGAATGPGQTVLFVAGAAETLVLADPGGFAGILAGFGPGDAVDVQGVTATLSYAAETGGGPGSLSLRAGGATVASLAVAGSYAGETFLAAPSADGTLVHVVQAAVSAVSGTLTVAPLAGGNVSLDEILADPAYAPGGAVSALVVDGPGTVVATADATIASVQVKSGTLRLNGETISTNALRAAAALVVAGGEMATAAVSVTRAIESAAPVSSKPITIDANGAITGFGTLVGDILDSGMLVAQGGRMAVTAALTGTGQITVGPGASLELGGSVSLGMAVGFQGGGRLILDDPSHFNASVTGFAAGDSVDLTGVTLSPADFSSDGVNSYVAAGGAAFELVGYAGPLEVDANGGVVACYCPGTLIQTDAGARPIETLAIGDRVLTEAGTVEPILWIGRRSYAPRFVAANPALWPIRLRSGALGNGLPQRDLLVSPKHAMLIDRVLIPAECLVNGATIVRDRPAGAVAYLHIELAEHGAIFAEGAASETFIDDGSRGMFHNAAEFRLMYPEKRETQPYCAPRVEHGFMLEAIRRRLASPAGQCSAGVSSAAG